MLVGDFKLCTKLKPPISHIPKRRIWKLKRLDVRLEYIKCVRETLANFNGENVNDWEEIKSCLTDASDKTCGRTKGAPRRKDTWWWDDTVDNAIKVKRKLVAKRRAKSAVYFALKSAKNKKFIFKMARKMKDDNKDIIGEKCVKDQKENMAFDNNSKAKTWRTHYSNLLNVEVPWNHNNLPNEPAVHSPKVLITEEMICKTIYQLKKNPSGVVLEMILASQQHIVPHLTKLANNIVAEEKIPKDWNLSHIMSCYKGKMTL